MLSNKKLLLIVIFFLIINSLSVYLVYYLITSNQSKNKEPNQSFDRDDIAKYISERNSLINVRTNHFLRKYTILDNGGSLTNNELRQVEEYLKSQPFDKTSKLLNESDVLPTLETLGYSDVISAYNEMEEFSDEQIPFNCYPSVNTIDLSNASVDSIKYSIELPEAVANFFEGEYNGYEYVSNYVYCITSQLNLLTRNIVSPNEYDDGFLYLVIFNVATREPSYLGRGHQTGYLVSYNDHIYSSLRSSSSVSGVIKPLLVNKNGDVYYANQASGGGWSSIALYSFNIKDTSPVTQVFDCTGGIEGDIPPARYGWNCLIYDQDNTLMVSGEKLTIK